MTASPDQPKRVMPVVWAIHEATRRRYSATFSLALIILANHMNDGLAWPSLEALSAECRLSQRQVQRALLQFARDSLISIESGTGRGFTSRYHLLASTVNGAEQPDLFGDPPKPAKPSPAKPAKPRKKDAVPRKPRKGGLTVHLPDPAKVDSQSTLPTPKGGLTVRKRWTPSPRESTKKNPLEGSTGLRPETAVAVSHSDPSGHQEFDPRKALWTEGVEALRGLTGQMNGEAKRQIGRFLKLAGGDAVGVLRALEVAKVEGPYEPIPWISAAIQARASTRLSPQEELRKRWNLPTFMAPNLDPEA